MNSTKTSTIEDANQVRWDLSILYADIDDPRLDSDLAKLAEMAKHFFVTYKGKLAELLGAAIKEYAEIEMLHGKIASYVSLRRARILRMQLLKRSMRK